MPQKDNFKIFYAISLAWQLGFIIVLPIGGFIFIGFLLDKAFWNNGLFIILGSIIGLVLTVYEIYNLLIPLIKDKDYD